MLNQSPDWRALLLAIGAAPGDDLPRLVAADWLEERGEPDRAEFIRIQCEIADRYDEFEQVSPDDPFKKRQRKLWAGPGVGDWFGPDLYPCLGHDLYLSSPGQPNPAGLVRRGFVRDVRATLAVFTTHAPALFGNHPTITRVTLSDREPGHWTREDGGSDYVWTVRTPNQIGTPGDLPREVFDLLRGGVLNKGNWVRRYPTRDAAMDALSAACVAMGRSVAAGHRHGVCEGCEGKRQFFAGGTFWDCDSCHGTGTRPGLPPLRVEEVTK